MNMVKVVRIGTTQVGRSNASVFCTVRIEGHRLSISGVVGPNRYGGCRGSACQIDKPVFEKFAAGWNQALVDKFFAVWERWHLNDMRPGTPRQMACLAEHASEMEGWLAEQRTNGDRWASFYHWALAVLEQHDLLIDDGYRYGSSWLLEELPVDVVAFLASLPDADKPSPWFN